MDGWREQHAAVLEHEVGEWEKLLTELDNGEMLAVTRRNEKLASELRATASAIRSEIQVMRTEVNELRRVVQPGQMPVALTTRRIGKRTTSTQPADESSGLA